VGGDERQDADDIGWVTAIDPWADGAASAMTTDPGPPAPCGWRRTSLS